MAEKKYFTIVFLLSVLFFSSTAVAGTPSVISYSPASGAKGVGTNANVYATFSEAVTGVSSTNYKVYAYSSSSATSFGDANSEIAGTVSYSGSKATFTPTTGLTNLKVHRGLVLTTGITSVSTSTAMTKNATWLFTVGAAADTGAPTISTYSPTQGAWGVAENAALVVTFSKDMDPSSITTSTVYIDGVTGTTAYSGANRQATFTPTNDLAYGKTYTAVITTGVKSAAGNALASEERYIFTVGSTGGSLKFSSVTGGVITLTVSGGGGTIQEFEAITDTSPSVVQTNKPADGTFPEGLVSLRVGNLPVGGNVTLRLSYDNVLPDGTQIWKSGPNGFFNFTDNATRVDDYTFDITIKDGGTGDADGVANGVIVDPVGPVTGLPDTSSSSGSSSGCMMNPNADMSYELILFLLGAVTLGIVRWRIVRS